MAATVIEALTTSLNEHQYGAISSICDRLELEVSPCIDYTCIEPFLEPLFPAVAEPARS